MVKKAKGQRGRTTLYTAELTAYICEQVAIGRSMVSITRDPGVPTYPTIMEWLKAHDEFVSMYRQAKEDQADTLADEIIAIADSVKDAGPTTAQRSTPHACASMQGKWVAAKLKPKVYGERVEAALTGTVTVEHTITDEDRAKALASIMARHAIQSAPNMLEAQRLLTDRKEGITDMPDR